MKITKTKNNTWTTLVSVTELNGKRHYKRFTDKNKNKVREMASNYLAEHTVYMESMAFEDCMQRLLDQKQKVCRPSTMHGYLSDSRVLKNEYETFCRKDIDRITGEDIQYVINDMKAQGRKPKTIKNRVGLIGEVFRSEGLKMPPVSLPRVIEPELRIPDADVISKMADAAAGTRMEIPLALAVFGLRRGEICAIKASDLDGNVLHIRRGISVDDDGFSYEMDSPKTSQSIRSLALPDHVVALIADQGCAWKGSPSSLSSAWPHLCEKAGVDPFRLHDCRHFFVSYCHEVLKLTDAQIMKLGGWKTDYVMKRHYRHALSDVSDVVSSGFGGLLEARG